jgi:hypothetical protein
VDPALHLGRACLTKPPCFSWRSSHSYLLSYAFFSNARCGGNPIEQAANSDHGIDGEIEFKDDQGRATGKRLYPQLKSGDSYLTKRKRDGGPQKIIRI